MKHTEFDKALRQRAAQETFATTPKGDDVVRRAMHKGRAAAAHMPAPRKRHAWEYALLAAGVVCVAALCLVFSQPSVDRQNGVQPVAHPAIVQTTALVAQNEEATLPQVQSRAWWDMWTVRLEAALRNDTQDIWLVQYKATVDGYPVQEPAELVWLEPGASCTLSGLWTAGESTDWDETSASMTGLTWGYQSYRVTAEMLFWLEGEWLSTSEEGYAEQQALIEDAFQNGAFILSPGEWENGMAGEMHLVLPDSYLFAHPDLSAVEYYTQAGMLQAVEDSTDHGMIPYDPNGRGFDEDSEPLRIAAGEGGVQRLMVADVGPEHSRFIVDRIFDSREAMEAFQAAYPAAWYDVYTPGGGELTIDAQRLQEMQDVQGFASSHSLDAWQDSQGVWHMTGGYFCWPMKGLESGARISLQACGLVRTDDEAMRGVLVERQRVYPAEEPLLYTVP